MRGIIKKLTSVVIIVSMIGACAGCKKKKDSTQVIQEKAESVMEAVLSGKGKTASKVGDFSDESLARINAVGDCDAIKALLEKTSYEVSAVSTTKGKKSMVCKIDVSMPDYVAAIEESGANTDDFIDAVDDQKENNYLSIELTMRFKEEDGEYVLTNGDTVVTTLYSDEMINTLAAFLIESGAEIEVDPTATSNTSNPTTKTPVQSAFPIVYQDDILAVCFVGMEADGMRLEIHNDSDETLVLNANSLSVNRMSVNEVFFEDNVPPHSVTEVVAECALDSSQPVGTISGQLRVRAYGNYNFDEYTALIQHTVIDDTVVVDDPDPVGPVIYQDDQVQIAFRGFFYEGVILSVKSLVDGNVRVEGEAIALNGRTVQDLDFYGRCVAPLSVGDVMLKCDVDQSMTVGEVSGMLTVTTSLPGSKKDERNVVQFDQVVIDPSVTLDAVPSGTLLYEDEEGLFRAYFKEVRADGVVLMEVENLSSYNINFIVDALALNRQSFNDYLSSGVIASHSIGVVEFDCGYDASVPVGEVSAYIRVMYMNAADGKDTSRFSINTVVIDDSVQVETPVPQGTLLYADENVKIHYKEVTDEGVAFEVENLTDMAWAIQVDELVINGTRFEHEKLVMSDEIAPHSVGVAVVHIEDFPYSAVETIGGGLRVVDIAIFDGYDAKVDETKVG
ncbi:MAG: hypothetical protein J5379_04310 [Clostridiales bacterium]|nr:hypothetical protein [Clostridiales bacterium]